MRENWEPFISGYEETVFPALVLGGLVQINTLHHELCRMWAGPDWDEGVMEALGHLGS